MSNPVARASPRDQLVVLAVGLAGAVVCVVLATPLPWTIGPLVATMGLHLALPRAAGDRTLPRVWSAAGQWIVGSTLGLYFTPSVVGQVARLWPWIALSIVVALALGVAGAFAYRRTAGLDRATAFFAAAIGGAAEMANQAERHGARVDRVAAAHALRVATVVVVVPFALRAAGVHGLDPYHPVTSTVHVAGLVALLAITGVCGHALDRRRVTNAWTIAPLVAAAALSIADVDLSAMPRWLVDIAQLAIGCSLGSRFSRASLEGAPRFVAATFAMIAGYLAVAAALAVGIASASGVETATAVLATSPGGIAEMSLTARNLALGVPIVTAFQAARLVVVVVTIGPLYAFVERR